jgi:DNA-binding NarL/FixJ family response regulator
VNLPISASIGERRLSHDHHFSSPQGLSAAGAQSSSISASARNRQPTTNNLADSVQIKTNGAGLASLVQPTQAQQVQQLYRRGNTVPQIAYNLNLSAQAVDGYLNIAKGK